MAQRLKATSKNIIRLWFGENTLLRQQKIEANPELWDACLRTNQTIGGLMDGLEKNRSRKTAQESFARAVQQELEAQPLLADQ
ncbi:hypothetical protein GCM10027299_27040 [Larkinella ripae]